MTLKVYSKYLFLILFCIILLNLTSALSVNMNSTRINVEYDKEINIPINITNDKSYSIYNIKVEGLYVTMATISNLSANTSKQQMLTIRVNKTGSFNHTTKFLSYKQTDCSVVGSTRYSIRIDSSGFNPSTMKICSGDIIDFYNDLGQSVNLNLNGLTNTCPGDITIPPNGSSTEHLFNVLGEKTISICSPLYLDNFVDVHNDTILTHSINDDSNLILNINSVLNPTTLNIDYITDTNYSMKYNEVKVGSLVIKNIGSEKAVNVKLTADWLIFSRNGFDIEPGVTKSIDFSVYPGVSNPSDTNKTYAKTLSITSDNTPTINRSVNIFILYSAEIAEQGDLAYLIYLKEIFCPTHPFSFLCEQQPRIIEKEVPKYACPAILAELTPEKILEYIDKASRGGEDANKVYNLIKIYAESQNVSIGEVLSKLDLSLNSQEKNEKIVSEGFMILTIIIFGILFAFLIGGGIFIFRKWYLKKQKGDNDL